MYAELVAAVTGAIMAWLAGSSHSSSDGDMLRYIYCHVGQNYDNTAVQLAQNCDRTTCMAERQSTWNTTLNVPGNAFCQPSPKMDAIDFQLQHLANSTNSTRPSSFRSRNGQLAALLSSCIHASHVWINFTPDFEASRRSNRDEARPDDISILTRPLIPQNAYHGWEATPRCNR